MKIKSDRLTVSFDNSFDDELGMCVTRKHGEKNHCVEDGIRRASRHFVSSFN